MTSIQVITEEPRSGQSRLKQVYIKIECGSDKALLVFYPHLSQVRHQVGDNFPQEVMSQAAESSNHFPKGSEDGYYWEVVSDADRDAIERRLSYA